MSQREIQNTVLKRNNEMMKDICNDTKKDDINNDQVLSKINNDNDIKKDKSGNNQDIDIDNDSKKDRDDNKERDKERNNHEVKQTTIDNIFKINHTPKKATKPKRNKYSGKKDKNMNTLTQCWRTNVSEVYIRINC